MLAFSITAFGSRGRDRRWPYGKAPVSTAQPFPICDCSIMVRKRDLHPKPVFDGRALLAFLADHNVKLQHANRIWKHVLANPGCELDAIPDLPSGFGAVLAQAFVSSPSTVVHVAESKVDHTVKLLIRLQDGKEVEAVLINHAGEADETQQNPNNIQDEKIAEQAGSLRAPKQTGADARHALCVSSQVGCRLGCTFCATGKLGLSGNLSAGEIIEQVLHARAYGRPVHSVVFMGMGEPLENTDSVLAAIETLVSPHCFSMAPRSITVSTVGIVPQMQRLMREAPSVRLSLSLHAPSQTLREKIMPVAKAFPLDKVLAVVDEYTTTRKGVGGSTRQRNTMIAYVLIAGVNDSDECAQELSDLLAGRPVFVNIIPYNPIDEDGAGYQTPAPDRIASFLQILARNSICAFERRHHGRDISAACGQLARDQRQKTETGDIEDYGCTLGKQKARESDGSRQIGTARTEIDMRTASMVLAAALTIAATASAFVLIRRKVARLSC